MSNWFDHLESSIDYVQVPETIITATDQNGKTLFKGPGSVRIKDGGFTAESASGDWKVTTHEMMSYVVNGSPDGPLEVEIKAFVQVQPPSLLPDFAGDFAKKVHSYVNALPPVTVPAGEFLYTPTEMSIHFELTREQTLDVLQQAKELLIEQGWAKGQFSVVDPESKKITYCTLGAIGKVLTDKYGLQAMGAVVYSDPAKILMRILENQDIATWNDRAERTFADVMDAFDAAILAAKEEIAKESA